jgi:hypothetical protein
LDGHDIGGPNDRDINGTHRRIDPDTGLGKDQLRGGRGGNFDGIRWRSGIVLSDDLKHQQAQQHH